jgi:hypothetical protein
MSKEEQGRFSIETVLDEPPKEVETIENKVETPKPGGLTPRAYVMMGFAGGMVAPLSYLFSLTGNYLATMLTILFCSVYVTGEIWHGIYKMMMQKA